MHCTQPLLSESAFIFIGRLTTGKRLESIPQIQLSCLRTRDLHYCHEMNWDKTGGRKTGFVELWKKVNVIILLCSVSKPFSSYSVMNLRRSVVWLIFEFSKFACFPLYIYILPVQIQQLKFSNWKCNYRHGSTILTQKHINNFPPTSKR